MVSAGISSLPGSALAGAAQSGSISNRAGSPAATDVARFAQLIGAPAATAATPVAGGGGLSDAVSSGIRQAAEAFRSRFDALQAGVKRVEKSQSVTGLIALQLDSVKMGVEMEFTGKIASKVVQDIEQLTKQQG
jgi:hypothetical protein